MAVANINGRFQFMRATKKEWKAWDGILLDGEIAIESDTLKMKFGNGLNKYKDLEYMTIGEIIIKDLSKEDIERLRGPVGPKGDRGDKGIQGIQGKTGPQGPQGIKGDKGETGTVGPQGPIGKTGPTGPQGPIGKTGPVGPQGPIGKTGNIGPEGKQGIQGKAGPTGPKGPQGERGLTGPAGPQGPKGDKSIVFSSTEPQDKGLVWVKNDNKRNTYDKIPINKNEIYYLGNIKTVVGEMIDTDIYNILIPDSEKQINIKDVDVIRFDNREMKVIKKYENPKDTQYKYFQLSNDDFKFLLDNTVVVDGDYEKSGYVGGYVDNPQYSKYELELLHKTGEETYCTASVYNSITKKWEKISEDGKMGPKGKTGPTGPKGDQGARGPQGAKGDKGDPGSQGIAGKDGTNGEKGDRGPAGPQGPIGKTGPTGPAGPQGLTGRTGPTGPQGAPGKGIVDVKTKREIKIWSGSQYEYESLGRNTDYDTLYLIKE